MNSLFYTKPQRVIVQNNMKKKEKQKNEYLKSKNVFLFS